MGETAQLKEGKRAGVDGTSPSVRRGQRDRAGEEWRSPGIRTLASREEERNRSPPHIDPPRRRDVRLADGELKGVLNLLGGDEVSDRLEL